MSMSSYLDVLRERLGYALSLPERTIRSLAAVAGGTTSLLTETLFPESLRGTTLYRIFVGDAQRFIIEKVAEVEQVDRAESGAAADDPRFIHKKMVGGALEAAGLFAMHISPLWVFAVAGDAAAGTQVFLNRLVNQLKSNGVLPLDARIDGLEDLLVAAQEASRTSAAAIDTPPLSRAELSGLAHQMTASYRDMFAKAVDLVPRLDHLWARIEEIAAREKVAPERVVGVITVSVADWGKKGIGSVVALGQTGSALLGEKILDSYSQTLDRISAEGLGAYVTRHMRPFLTAAAGHFDPERKTWTESITGSLFGVGREGEAQTLEATERPVEPAQASTAPAGGQPAEQPDSACSAVPPETLETQAEPSSHSDAGGPGPV
jgi:hypothetical protein